MIFLTVGSELPFDRLVACADNWCDQNPSEHVFGQIGQLGAENYLPKNFDYVAFLPPADYEARLKDARCIISHVGMGTIITCLLNDKPLVAMPRLGAKGETRNNHQVATGEKFGAYALISLANDQPSFNLALDDALRHQTINSSPSITSKATGSLVEHVQRFIWSKEEL